MILAVLLVAGLTVGATASHDALRTPRERRVRSGVVPFRQGRGRPAGRRGSPPIGLTASDGTGLALVAVEANGVLEPPLAFTELHLTFENPRDR